MLGHVEHHVGCWHLGHDLHHVVDTVEGLWRHNLIVFGHHIFVFGESVDDGADVAESVIITDAKFAR